MSEGGLLLRFPCPGDVWGSPPDRMVVWVDHHARTFGTEPADFHPTFVAAPIEPGWTETFDAAARGFDCTDDPTAHLRAHISDKDRAYLVELSAEQASRDRVRLIDEARD